MRKIIKQSTLPLVAILLLAGGYYFYQNSRQAQPEDLYKFGAVTQGNVEQAVSANGTINPVTLVSVGTQVSGRVSKLYVDFNDKVEKGQVLLELDDALFTAQIAQSQGSVRNAEASVELAKANEARIRSLYEQEYVSRQELDQSVQALKSARAVLESARAQLQRDKTNLSYSIIRSPVSGIVIDRQIDVGQTVAASFQTPTLIKIAQDLSKMQIDTSFAEADIGNIKVGQVARFSVDAFPNLNFEGTVKQIRLNPVTTSNVVSYNVVISVDNPQQILLPGMTAYVSIVFAKHENVMLVPNAALRYKPKLDSDAEGVKATGNGSDAGQGQGKSRRKKPAEMAEAGGFGRGKVFVLQDGKPQVRQVKVGITDGKLTEIISDTLKPGDQVITGNAQADGQAPANAMRAPRMF
ncbi:efflux RND transporter periplasmic adaptor subunit [Methylotenera sp. G11]|uniref:efflux RND transporter periplasmic adaptor subunit n=1 Tax=Methylotenera sp. G11 TaxID=1506585 RepID=UPI0006462AD2|nr:efflux RND transporter periplasmic adaptor subunit [Methylotenera sp. G11]